MTGDNEDGLDIPDFLKRSLPENMARWKEGRRNWRPSRARAEAARKVNRDSKGRVLPDNMSAESWAFLHAMEAAEAAAKKARDAEKAALKKAERAERAQVKAAVKAKLRKR